ncbi:unnamed protein product [Sphagnum balticum]
MHAAGFWLLFNGYVLPGIIVLGIVSGWLMHEGGHYSLTDLVVRLLVAQPAQQTPRDASEDRLRRGPEHATPGGLYQQGVHADGFLAKALDPQPSLSVLNTVGCEVFLG